MVGIYDVHSTREVLSVKVADFLGRTYKRFQEQQISQQYAEDLLREIWDTVSGCVDSETVDIFDLVWKEVSNGSNRF